MRVVSDNRVGIDRPHATKSATRMSVSTRMARAIVSCHFSRMSRCATLKGSETGAGASGRLDVTS